MDRATKIISKNAAFQDLSNALNAITLACTADLLENSKILHSSRYSSETNADRPTEIINKNAAC
jgi:hypothetical protein